MYEQTCIYTAYNPQSQRKKSIVGIFTTTISPKKHSMAIILTMKHFKGTQHEHSSPVSPEKKTFTVHTHAEKNPTYICMHVLHHQADPHLHSSYTSK